MINDHRDTLHNDYITKLSNNHRITTLIPCKLPSQYTTITLIVDNGDYTLLDNYISSDIHQSLQQIKLQQPPQQLDILIDAMIDGQSDFQSSRSNWKLLLDDYLTTKYGEHKPKYITHLEELRILP
jgi:hypothetical protein